VKSFASAMSLFLKSKKDTSYVENPVKGKKTVKKFKKRRGPKKFNQPAKSPNPHNSETKRGSRKKRKMDNGSGETRITRSSQRLNPATTENAAEEGTKTQISETQGNPATLKREGTPQLHMEEEAAQIVDRNLSTNDENNMSLDSKTDNKSKAADSNNDSSSKNSSKLTNDAQYDLKQEGKDSSRISRRKGLPKKLDSFTTGKDLHSMSKTALSSEFLSEIGVGDSLKSENCTKSLTRGNKEINVPPKSAFDLLLVDPGEHKESLESKICQPRSPNVTEPLALHSSTKADTSIKSVTALSGMSSPDRKLRPSATTVILKDIELKSYSQLDKHEEPPVLGSSTSPKKSIANKKSW
jgi:hypothetical protein